MPAVGGVAERAEIGIVRRLNAHAAAGSHEPMKLLHSADHVGDMLDDMDGSELVEGVVGKRVGDVVEIAENVGAGGGIAVYADRSRILIDAAADVERSHNLECGSAFGCF